MKVNMILKNDTDSKEEKRIGLFKAMLWILANAESYLYRDYSIIITMATEKEGFIK